MKSLFALLGRDVSQSLSPSMHQAAAWELGLDLAYVACPMADRDHFIRGVRALQVLGARGANVTMPYKEAAYGLVDRTTSEAASIGSVNTIRFGADGMVGHNTDGPGLVRLLDRLKAGQTLQVLGTGGAARAAAWAGVQRRARVVLCGRRSAEAIAARIGVEAAPFERVPGASVIIHALPPAVVAPWEIVDRLIDREAQPHILDLTYHRDRESDVVRTAREHGLSAEDGRALLAEQGALSLSFWTGASVERGRRAMRAAVGRPFDSTSGQV